MLGPIGGLRMIRFECRVCQSPLWLSEVGAWLSGEPFCNATCSAKVDETMLRQKTPSVEEHLQALPTLLGNAGVYVREVSEYVLYERKREEKVQNDLNMGAGIGKFLFGPVALVGAIAVTSKLEGELVQHRQALWDRFAHLELLMKDVVRRSMALHGAGHVMAPTLIAAVQNTDRLDADDLYGASDLLVQIFADLQEAHRVTAGGA